MKTAAIALLGALTFTPGCTSQTQHYHDYRDGGGTETTVKVNIPLLKLEKLGVYETPLYPGKVLVAPGRPQLLRVHDVYPKPNLWLAAVPTFEPQFRGAALEALRQGGRKECVIEKTRPVPERGALEFEFRCK